MNDLNSLYDSDIKAILQKKHIKINGIVPKNQLPKQLKNGWYIINLDDTVGSHWTCFKFYNGNIDYIDSFGASCPIEVMNKVGSKCHLQYSTVEIQDLMTSDSCRWFCICAIAYYLKKQTKEFDYNGFLSHFNKNTIKNDLLLKKFLIKLGITII